MWVLDDLLISKPMSKIEVFVWRIVQNLRKITFYLMHSHNHDSCNNGVTFLKFLG
ncbi:hypothetical protein [Moraxella lacunata]|uniref:hypothetical protein n=1 Tax=Moraxella lacunata TaxID=477 RepID=UPI003EE36590